MPARGLIGTSAVLAALDAQGVLERRDLIRLLAEQHGVTLASAVAAIDQAEHNGEIRLLVNGLGAVMVRRPPPAVQEFKVNWIVQYETTPAGVVLPWGGLPLGEPNDG